jgi:hypothetical protein
MKKYMVSVLTACLLLSCNKLVDLFHPSSGSNTAGALDFDGADDEVNTGDWFRYQVFTIQFWAKPGATQNPWANIIDNQHASYISWTIQQRADTTNQYYYGGGAIVYFTLQADVWQQVTVVKGKDSAAAYVNGQLADKQPLIIPIDYPYNHVLRLGQWAGGGRAWNGQLDEVRLWNRALSQQEIQNNINCQLTGSESGLVAYYRFNQGTINADNAGVTTLTDLSGHNHNGRLENFALTGSHSNWVQGKVAGNCH